MSSQVPKLKEKRKKNSGHTGASKSTAADVHAQPPHSGNGQKSNASTPTDLTLASSSVGHQPQATNVLVMDEFGCQSGVKVIINELLTYAVYYRDRCTFTDLHKLFVHFYAPSEIL